MPRIQSEAEEEEVEEGQQRKGGEESQATGQWKRKSSERME